MSSKRELSEILEEISTKLDKLSALIICQNENRDVKIRVLTNSGFTSNEIGDLLGLSGSAVRDARKKTKNNKKRKN